jgi:hypothetical protein
VHVKLRSDETVVFDHWLDDSFGKIIDSGTPFAVVTGATTTGFLVTNFPVYLSSHADFTAGSTITPGTTVAYGGTDGEYAGCYCLFAAKLNPDLDSKR